LPKDLDVARSRYEIIKPLIDRPHRTAADVEERAKEVGKGRRTLYKWIKLYNEAGVSALAPRIDKRGNRTKRFPPEIERIVASTIKLHSTEKTMKSCWEIIHEKCLQLGYPPSEIPSYRAIRNR